jgi:hypothetical protein
MASFFPSPRPSQKERELSPFSLREKLLRGLCVPKGYRAVQYLPKTQYNMILKTYKKHTRAGDEGEGFTL